ncbi:RNA polymerase sigma-54 factor [bacterium]|nr:MAG: RNA polymerase sigma-54 factor [bacterium]
MAYELKQEIKLSQTLVMTPQLQLAIKLLQLSMLELVDMVREEVESNPVLEDTAEETPAETPAAEKTEEVKNSPETDWQTYIEGQSDLGKPRLDFNAASNEEDDFYDNVSSGGGSLREHLLWQLNLAGLSEDEATSAEFIIGNIDEDGYLRLVERDALPEPEFEDAVLLEIARHTGASPEMADKALKLVQQLDPVGVGSRTLKECLLTQARQLPVRDTVVEEVIASHLDDLGRKNYKLIAKSLGIRVEAVYEAAKVINKCLVPAPGRGYGADTARAIVPDVHITKVGGEYVITLNDNGMPKLRISKYYRELLKGECRSNLEAKAYLQEKLKSAFWLIKSVHQRQRTIYRVVECIVRFQRDFLDHGVKYLKPMVLRDIAGELGIHESTVSRVTSNKYAETPRGLFELKYFFSNSMPAEGGEGVSSEYIKKKVKDLIEGEDAMHPLSDQEIVDTLKGAGITLARRTATKYREGLGFLSSSRRKTHF